MSRAESFAPLPPERLARWSKFAKWDTPYFPKFIGLDLEEVRRDYARMNHPIAHLTTNTWF